MRIRAEQVKLLYMNSRWGIFASTGCSVLLAFALRKDVPHSILAVWLGMNLMVAAGRYLLFRKYTASPYACELSGQWIAYFNAGLLLSGLAFGSAGLFMFVEDSVISKTFLTFILGGMMAGSVATYSVLRRSFLIYSTPLLLPLIVHFFSHGREIDGLMGILLLLFFGVMLILSWQAYSAINSSLRLRLEKERLLEETREGEERFRKLSDGTFEGIVVHRDGVILDINSRLEEMFGYEASEAVGKNVLDFVVPEVHGLVKEKIAMRGSIPFEVTGLRKNGERFDIMIMGRDLPFKGENARFVVIRDISVQKRVEDELRKSELSYRTMTENLPGIAYRLHMISEKKITFYNNKLPALTGYSQSDINPGGICILEDFICSDDRNRVLESIRHSIRLKIPFEVEYRIWNKDAGMNTFIERGTPIFDKNGALLYIDGFITDVTDRKIKDELEFMISQYRDIFDSHDKMFFSMNMVNRRLLMISRGCEKVYGIRQEEFMRNPLLLRETVYPEDLKYVDEVKHDLSIGKAVNFEYRILHADGGIRWVKSNIVPTVSQARVLRVDGISEDITEQKAAEDKLKEYAFTQRELLKEVNHRVKNNLIAIIGMMRIETNRARQEGYIDLLKNLIGRVSGLASVHSMLSCNGWRPLSISSLANEIVESTLNNILPHGAFVYEISFSEVRVSKVQAHHLAMLFNELVSNSVKHSGKNEGLVINLDIHFDEREVRLQYRDNGKGFSPEILNGYKDRDTIGLDLLVGVVRESLRGDVHIFNENGANTVITFGLEMDETFEKGSGSCLTALQ